MRRLLRRRSEARMVQTVHGKPVLRMRMRSLQNVSTTTDIYTPERKGTYPGPYLYQSRSEPGSKRPQKSHYLESTVQLRRQYWKLEKARERLQADFSEAVELQDSPKRPITCLLCPDLTPSRLLEHLQSRRATDACILEWTRRLQMLRQEGESKEQTYGLTFLGKRR